MRGTSFSGSQRVRSYFIIFFIYVQSTIFFPDSDALTFAGVNSWLDLDVGVDAMENHNTALEEDEGPEQDLDDVTQAESDVTAFARAHRERRKSFHGEEPCCKEFYDLKLGR